MRLKRPAMPTPLRSSRCTPRRTSTSASCHSTNDPKSWIFELTQTSQQRVGAGKLSSVPTRRCGSLLQAGLSAAYGEYDFAIVLRSHRREVRECTLRTWHMTLEQSLDRLRRMGT